MCTGNTTVARAGNVDRTHSLSLGGVVPDLKPVTPRTSGKCWQSGRYQLMKLMVGDCRQFGHLLRRVPIQISTGLLINDTELVADKHPRQLVAKYTVYDEHQSDIKK